MLIKARSDSAADIQRVAEFPRDRNYLCGNAVAHKCFHKWLLPVLMDLYIGNHHVITGTDNEFWNWDLPDEGRITSKYFNKTSY